MKIDLDALERLAREATPGPWEHRAVPTPDGRGVRRDIVCHRNEEGRREDLAWATDGLDTADMHSMDAEFIAAANPTTVLALIAELRAARAVTQAAVMWANETIGERTSYDLCLEAAVDAYHAALPASANPEGKGGER